jgi:MFS transporter, putative metabolite:H+ symporter
MPGNASSMAHRTLKPAIALAVVAAALGFFVDAYDLLLYGIVRNQSLASLGVGEGALLSTGIDLLNAQLCGMLLGGIAWGIVGDVYGRRRVLFGSIFLYSAATLMNGLVDGVGTYGVCRFIAGAGLAGELGAGATLVTELMSKENRGWGTMIVAAVGVLGVVTASLVGDRFAWRTAYFIGGGLGFLLLLLRLGVGESLMFERARSRSVSRGNFPALFTSAKRFRRYASLILFAMPIWYAIGVLVTFSPELGAALGDAQAPQAGRAILLYYLGLTLGDLTSGILSQVFRTRKKIILAFMLLSALSCAAYFLFGGRSLVAFYTVCGLMGWASGYWAVFITVAAEHFGTNLRATVAITAPNFVRGLTALLTISFKGLRPAIGMLPAAMLIGAAVFVVAFIALTQIEETFGKDLDYMEPV